MPRALLVAVALVLTAVPARADLVFFHTGRTMSVRAHRVEGTSLVLALRGGGEMVCDRSIVARIEPDEVPYPEPHPEGVSAVAAAAHPSGARPGSLQRDPRFDPLIEQFSAEHGVDPTLVRAVIQVESDYQPRARSSKGAMGLMQLMPETARRYAVRDPYDPASNIRAGVTHLRGLLDRLPLNLALAAYNAGEASIRRFGGVPPYAETRTYISRVLALASR
jgi:hypothetical protein